MAAFEVRIPASVLRVAKSGRECCFLPAFQVLDDGVWAAKIYRSMSGCTSRWLASTAMARQQRAAAAGLAPPAQLLFAALVTTRSGVVETRHGYLTRQAAKVGRCRAGDLSSLRSALKDAGLPYGDVRRDNVGWYDSTVSAGWVMLDFGYSSSDHRLNPGDV